MQRPRIEKVVVNCSVGEGGARLEKALKILESLLGQKPEVRKAKKTIRGFGIHRGEPIALRATLRKQAALDFLKRALAAVNNSLKASSFDELGNVSFGIKEHLEIPGTRYDPELGIIGMDVTVHVTKPGYRVATRRYRRAKIGKRQRVSREEAMEFIKSLGVTVVEE
uniref:Large ribosomal subunit protein uL5 n=1 Tax=Caldiarchaeum subterraneum TaxID=311458 RepID=A0A7C5QDH3_CALS0